MKSFTICHKKYRARAVIFIEPGGLLIDIMSFIYLNSKLLLLDKNFQLLHVIKFN
jgi:hypothetical protein